MASDAINNTLDNDKLQCRIGSEIVRNPQVNSQLHTLISYILQHNVEKNLKNILILKNTNKYFHYTNA